MCAVCWSSVQLVPAAAVGVRAFYAHRLNRGLDRPGDTPVGADTGAGSDGDADAHAPAGGVASAAPLPGSGAPAEPAPPASDRHPVGAAR